MESDELDIDIEVTRTTKRRLFWDNAFPVIFEDAIDRDNHKIQLSLALHASIEPLVESIDSDTIVGKHVDALVDDTYQANVYAAVTGDGQVIVDNIEQRYDDRNNRFDRNAVRRFVEKRAAERRSES